MNTAMITAFRSVMSLLLLGFPVMAQGAIPDRAWHATSSLVEIGQLEGMLFVQPAASPTEGNMATVTCNLQGPGSGPTLRLVLPFEHVGGVQELTPGHFLISGCDARKPATGFISRIQVDPAAGQIVLRETAMYAGADIFGIAWEPTTPLLMAIDKESKKVVFGLFVWPPSDVAQPVLPVSLAPALDSLSCPQLDSDGPHIMAVGASIYRVIADQASRGRLVVPSGGGWAATPEVSGNANEWVVDVGQGQAGHVRIKCVAPTLTDGGLFSLVDVDNQSVVSSGAVATVNSWIAIPFPPAFYDYPGYRYRVTGSSSGDSRDVFPLLRYGQPEAGGAVVPGQAQMFGPSIYVGSMGGEFLVPTTVSSIAGGVVSSPAQAFDAYLLIGLGFRGQAAPADPITGSGSASRLQFLAALGAGQLQARRTSAVAMTVPVPNIGELADCVVLSQWAILLPGQPQSAVYSDIAGARIRPAAGQQAGRLVQDGRIRTRPELRQLVRDAAAQHSRYVAPGSRGPASLWVHRLRN